MFRPLDAAHQVAWRSPAQTVAPDLDQNARIDREADDWALDFQQRQRQCPPHNSGTLPALTLPLAR